MSKKIFLKDPQKFNLALAGELKKVPGFESPEWVQFVKTGVAKERVPYEEDFWYMRAASILRQLYIKGVVGVGKLRTRYGSRKNQGGRPDRFRKAGGKIIRTILQKAEEVGFVEKISKRQFGRRLTQHGREFLDGVEVPVIEGKKIEVEKLKEEVKEKKVEKENVVVEDGETNEIKQGAGK